MQCPGQLTKVVPHIVLQSNVLQAVVLEKEDPESFW
jgi:hypothetical protein